MKVSNFEEYILHSPKTVGKENKKWIDSALSFADKNLPVLEIGSGTGIDADYIESQDFTVHRTDIDDRFIAYQKEKGKNVQKLDILNDKIKEKYSLIFINAVLHHFNYEELGRCLKKIKTQASAIAFSLPNSYKVNIPEIEHELGLEKVYFQKTDMWCLYVFFNPQNGGDLVAP